MFGNILVLFPLFTVFKKKKNDLKKPLVKQGSDLEQLHFTSNPNL